MVLLLRFDPALSSAVMLKMVLRVIIFPEKHPGAGGGQRYRPVRGTYSTHIAPNTYVPNRDHLT